MPWMIPAAIATLSSAVILTLVYLYLYEQHKERYLKIWMASWFVYSLRFVCELALIPAHKTGLLLVANQLLSLISGFLLLWGSCVFLNQPLSRRCLYGTSLIFAWIIEGTVLNLSLPLLSFPTFIFLGAIYIRTGTIFLKASDVPGIGTRITGWAFIIWGLHKADYPFLRPLEWFAPWGYLLGATLGLFAAIGVLLVYFEKTKQDLLMSKERFRLMAENAQDIIYRYRILPNPGFEFINSSATSILGYEPEEFYALSKSGFRIVCPEDFERMRGTAQAGAHNENPETIRVTRKDGSTVWFELRNTYIRNSEGAVEAVEGIARDISDKKRFEEELEFKSMLLDSATDSVFIIDMEGNFIYFNEAAYATRGYTKEEFRQISLMALNAEEHRELIPARMRELMKNGSLKFESAHYKKDGTIMHVEICAHVVELDGKQVVAAAVRDITERKHTEEALKESEERYRNLVDSSPDAILVHNKGKIVYANEATAKLAGVAKPGDLIGKNVMSFVHPDSYETIAQRIKDLMRGTPVGLIEEKFVAHDGRVFTADVSATPVIYNGKRSAQVIVRDITERKQAEEEIRQSEARFKAVFDNAGVGVMLIGTQGSFLTINPALQKMFGYTMDELSKMSFKDITHPEDLGNNLELFRDMIAGHRDRCELEKRYVCKDGSILWGHLNVSSVRDAEGNPLFIVAMVQDITERKKAAETIEYMAYYDLLTDLPNRMLLNDRATLALANARRNKQMLALLLLDLDNFKTINDTLGHTVGDMLLQGVADRLKRCLRESDTVARLGGDEFVLLLPHISSVEDATSIAQKVIDTLKPAFNFGSRDLHVTTSIGIALYPDDGEDAQTLIKNADTALNRAKDEGRDAYQLYTPTMNAHVLKRLSLENSLRKALKRNEFVLHYQPQVSLATGEIIGMEALLRWNHPELGLVSPAEFIPLAEETGLIVPIGEWVLQTACKQNKAWHDAGYTEMRISVNISARQFHQEELLKMVETSLKTANLSADYLDLEITESILMKDAEAAIETLCKLKDLGIRMSIDDFGTGYSSLSYLKKFPIDTLKIDRSFICDIANDSDDAPITEAIITLAHSLHIKAVAEGVETTEQMQLLSTLNCDEIQGFLFSRPLPANEATKLIIANKRLCA